MKMLLGVALILSGCANASSPVTPAINDYAFNCDGSYKSSELCSGQVCGANGYDFSSKIAADGSPMIVIACKVKTKNL